MKTLLIIALSLGLLFSLATLASAEILFGLSAETGSAAVSADYSAPASGDVSKSAGITFVNGNFNLLGTKIRLEYGVSDLSPYKLTASKVRIGWDIGLTALKAEVFGGYQQFVFTDDTLPNGNQNNCWSLIGGVRLESRINRFTVSGAAVLPLKSYYNNGVREDYNAGLNDWSLGVSYSPMPLVDLFINYRAWQANSQVVNLGVQSYTVGAKISF